MPRKQHSYHYIYKTTCKVTGRYYIGMHSTSNLDDMYLGSGKRLWHSIRKYGKENHTKEILEFLPDRSSLKDKEREIVNEDLLQEPMCMNLQIGGGGGFVNEEHKRKFLSADPLRIKSNDKKRELLKDEKWATEYKKNKKEAWNRPGFKEKFISENLIGKNNPFFGKQHSKEYKEMIGLINSEKQKGSANSQYGSCWITNGLENKKIKKNTEIPDGWKKGRVFLKI